MSIAPATLPIHVDRKASGTDALPRVAMKAPKATTVSAGIGGKTFSTAATSASAAYSAAGGSDVSQSSRCCNDSAGRRSVGAEGGDEGGDGDAGESLAPADPAHALVRLPLHAHRLRRDAQRGGEALAHLAAVGRDLRLLGDHGDVDLLHDEADRANALDGGSEHLDRVPAAVRRVGVGEHLADVARRGGAEDGVGDRVRYGIAVGVADEADLGRNRHAAEQQRAAGLEAVRVVADAGAARA